MWYISLSYALNGYIKNAIIKMQNSDVVSIKEVTINDFNHVVGYKYWQRCGFTDKSRIVAEMFSAQYQIPIKLSEVYKSMPQIIENRNPPCKEPTVDGKKGFLFFDKDGSIVYEEKR